MYLCQAAFFIKTEISSNLKNPALRTGGKLFILYKFAKPHASAREKRFIAILISGLYRKFDLR